MSRFVIKQNDTSPGIRDQLTANGAPVDLTGATVRFTFEGKFKRVATIEDAALGIARYDWQAGDTDTAGEFNAEWEVTYADNSIETFPNAGYIILDIRPELVAP